MSRTSGAAIGPPTPAACDSTMLRWSAARLAGFDAHVRQAAKAGVDAVDRLASREVLPRPPSH